MSDLILTERSNITAIADAVRNKTGSTGEMTLDGITSGINSIQTGVDLPELTNEGTASDMLVGKQLIDDEGNVITGSMPNNGTISSTMDGISIKSVSIPSGYTSGGTVSLDNTIDNEVSEQTNLIAQIMDKVENLPEASNGDSESNVQTATVTVNTMGGTLLTYVGIDGISTISFAAKDINVVVPSICYAKSTTGYMSPASISGNVEILWGSPMSAYIFSLTGDASISVSTQGSDSGS